MVTDETGRLLPTDVMRERPAEGVWSALEYLAHMRDVAEFYRDRIHRVLTEDRPNLRVDFRFAELAELRSYRSEEPTEVLAAFEERSESVRRQLDGLTQDRWSRIGVGSDGDERTLSVLARRFAHECHHHLLDVERCIDRRP